MRRIYFLFIALTLSLGCMAQGFPPYRSEHRPPQHRSGNRPMREVNPEYKMTAETFVADSLCVVGVHSELLQKTVCCHPHIGQVSDRKGN